MIDPISGKARRDRYGSKINRTHSPILAYATPWITIMFASLLPQLPIASAIPLIPPLGYLMMIAWRLVRPGLLPVWAGTLLGMFDDLFSGQPFGSATLLWSLTMLSIELLEARFPWRGFLQDWLVGVVFIAAYLIVAAMLSGARIEITAIVVMVPQFLLSICIFPIIARMVAVLDRFRLMRVRVIG
ncbi:rod shape-determining protein MreD [Altererythrobacter sp. N1]|uniref:Rod shape-determining protein MreD n=1 Tax=Tsuneonella suprasediminis TaxID=2306996 RepID=A0A419R3L1_9SPHN|nr:rod shape-determining protein MreD [Tsuneonella suprasediminis]RJX68778.1 rod shape-determining protein MreD [Tsuneonella suprasediminis]UBS32119.1 rod shape-determining protein MreD [Altererythrobacter sp. N1]